MSEKIKRYTSEAVDVTYSVRRCIHAAECVRGLPAVFDTNKRPWIQPDQATADAVAEVVMRCPTGALHFERKDGGAAEAVPTRNVITPTANGPLHVRGDVRLVSDDGETVLVDTRVALCRCGRSQNKPFCDNAHREAGFTDAGEVAAETAAGETAAAAPNGPQTLTVNPSTNGPLLLEGDLEIHSADGQTVHYAAQVALCRCGHSRNKPFCDGSHRRVGFTSAAQTTT